MTNKLALVVAVALGVLSILGIRFYVEKIKTQYEQTAQLVDVPVASRDLKPGDVIAESDVQTKRFPRAAIEGLGTSYFKEEDKRAIVGLRLYAEIKGQQIFQQYHFTRRGARAPLQVPPGFRALTIPVSSVTGLAGMLRPGDNVDVICSEDFKVVPPPGFEKLFPSTERLKFTRTLIRKATILAIDANTEKDASFTDYATVTLLLRPADVNRMCHAIDHGAPLHLTKLGDAEDAAPTMDVTWPDKVYHEFEKDVRDGEVQIARERGQK